MVVAVLSLVLAGTALAAPTSSQPSKDGTDGAARLEKAKQRIAAMVERMEKVKDKALKTWEKAEARLAEAARKLESEGEDTAKLLAAGEAARSMVKMLEKDLDTLAAKLKEASKLATQETMEQFKEALRSAKELWSRVREDVKELKTYIRTNIKPLLKQGGKNKDKKDMKDKPQTAPESSGKSSEVARRAA